MGAERGGYPDYEGVFDGRIIFSTEAAVSPFDALFHDLYVKQGVDRRLRIYGWTIQAGGLDPSQGVAFQSVFTITLAWARAGVSNFADFLDQVNSTNVVEVGTATVPATAMNLRGYSAFDGVVSAPDDLVDSIAARVEFTSVPATTQEWVGVVTVWGREV